MCVKFQLSMSNSFGDMRQSAIYTRARCAQRVGVMLPMATCQHQQQVAVTGGASQSSVIVVAFIDWPSRDATAYFIRHLDWSQAAHCKAHGRNRKIGIRNPWQVQFKASYTTWLCRKRRLLCKFQCKSVQWGISPCRWNITLFWLFWLSCPVLSCHFFLGRTVKPIFMLYGSSDVFPRKKCLLEARTIDDVILGKYAPKPTETDKGRLFIVNLRDIWHCKVVLQLQLWDSATI